MLYICYNSTFVVFNLFIITREINGYIQDVDKGKKTVSANLSYKSGQTHIEVFEMSNLLFPLFPNN